eukprot:1193125-Prorocentrum_minimum.AAC.3
MANYVFDDRQQETSFCDKVVRSPDRSSHAVRSSDDFCAHILSLSDRQSHSVPVLVTLVRLTQCAETRGTDCQQLAVLCCLPLPGLQQPAQQTVGHHGSPGSMRYGTASDRPVVINMSRSVMYTGVFRVSRARLYKRVYRHSVGRVATLPRGPARGA